jgi:hypothetical protein
MAPANDGQPEMVAAELRRFLPEMSFTADANAALDHKQSVARSGEK